MRAECFIQNKLYRTLGHLTQINIANNKKATEQIIDPTA